MGKFREKFISLDQYQAPIGLNYHGKESIPSVIGLITTIVMMIVWLTYAANQAISTANRSSLTIKQTTLKDAIVPTDELLLNDSGFKVAFAIAAQPDKNGDLELLDSKKYLTYEAYMYTKDTANEISEQKFFDIYTCTEEDYEQFAPIRNDQEQAFELVKRSNVLQCIDLPDDAMLFGTRNFYHQRLNLRVRACKDSDSDECINTEDNIDQMKTYLDKQSLNFYLYANSQKFYDDIFDDDCVQTESIIQYKQFLPDKTVYSRSQIKSAEISDDISLLQVGQSSEQREYFEFLWQEFEDSTQNNFPESYKVASVLVERDQDVFKTVRHSSDFLMWLSDIGGILGVLKSVGYMITGSVAVFQYQSYLIERLYRVRKPNTTIPRKNVNLPTAFEVLEEDIIHSDSKLEKLKSLIAQDFYSRATIVFPYVFQILCSCMCLRNRKKYKYLMKKHDQGVGRLEKDLDYLRIFKSVRQLKIQNWCLLNQNQRQCSYHLGSQVLSDNDDFEHSSDLSDEAKKEIERVEEINNFTMVDNLFSRLDKSFNRRILCKFLLLRESKDDNYEVVRQKVSFAEQIARTALQKSNTGVKRITPQNEPDFGSQTFQSNRNMISDHQKSDLIKPFEKYSRLNVPGDDEQNSRITETEPPESMMMSPPHTDQDQVQRLKKNQQTKNSFLPPI